METNTRARVIVSGRVQGVFYRQTTKDKAVSLGLTGWVRNEADGSVALEANGSRDSIESLISWCQQGPPSARVDKVEVEWLDDVADNEQQSGFRIVH